MNQQEYDAAVAAFIRAKGVTRCPTACAVHTQASLSEADRLALRRLDDQREARRREKRQHEIAMFRFGHVA